MIVSYVILEGKGLYKPLVKWSKPMSFHSTTGTFGKQMETRYKKELDLKVFTLNVLVR